MDGQLKRITVLGGGTGTYTALLGLKKHPVDLSAIVSIADNGGSTGLLRDELGVLPPGDLRQCLVALSSADDVVRRLFTFRFPEGGLRGQNCGNLILSALEIIYGDRSEAIRHAHRLLNVRGRVIPASVHATNLCARLEDGTVVDGEHSIDEPRTDRAPIRSVFLSPSVRANRDALSAIAESDLVVLGPGDLYTSIIPVLLVKGIRQALAETDAKIVFVLNLAWKAGQTDDFTAKRFVHVVQDHVKPAALDAVIVNSEPIPPELFERYLAAGEPVVKDDFANESFRIIRCGLLADGDVQHDPSDDVKRSLLRHDPDKLANAIVSAF
ncbi:YvcK family protein [candidate division WWE3 bacterium]|uniref:Putative gluconeogenesis factor n=1 Tax=candidate division WWE3 bacterium TaxID=2053526 RepID=A0A928TPY0_UNCKA|nr:YvcK family protein [candidate division WWE3 bacterium]